MLAAIIYAVVGVGIIVASTVTPEVPTPTPASSEAVVTPRPAPTMDPSLVTLIRSAHLQDPAARQGARDPPCGRSDRAQGRHPEGQGDQHRRHVRDRHRGPDRDPAGRRHHRADVAGGLQRHRQRGRQDTVRAVRGPRRASAGRRGCRGRGPCPARHQRAPAPRGGIADAAPHGDSDPDAQRDGRGDPEHRADARRRPRNRPPSRPPLRRRRLSRARASLPRRRRARRASSRTAASRWASNRGRSSWRRAPRERSSGPLPTTSRGAPRRWCR